jgi:riboflavin synthase
MFTGIVEANAKVQSIELCEPRGHERARPASEGSASGPRETSAGSPAVVRLVLSTELDVATLAIGASIAVDGVCLTVVDRAPGQFAADVGPETLARTTLGGLRVGAAVHLERPLRIGDPLGGHLVAGHVDGIGIVRGRRERGDALELDVTAPAAVAPFLAPKGSIAIDGVSLTVNAVEGDLFSVTLIPHTLAVTHLGAKAVGASVNLEADLIAKHLERLMAPYLKNGLDRDLSGEVPRRPRVVR